MAAAYVDDWGQEDRAAAGWGDQDEAAFQNIYAGMSEEARSLYNNPVLGQKLRAQIRQSILQGHSADKAASEKTAFQYGGVEGKAASDAAYFRQQAENAQRRPGEVIDYSAANRMGAQAQESRGAQLRMADLMAQRAVGKVPSIAEMQANRDIGRGMADQSSIAAGARGAAGLALAQQQQGANSAALTSRISNDAQVNGAKERLDAEQAAFGAYSGMRQGDYAGQAIEGGQAQAQAQLNAAQRAQNDAYAQGMYGNEMGVNTTQLQAQQNQQAAKTGRQMMAIQAQQARDARADANMMGGIGAGAAIMGTLGSFFSDERAKVPASFDDMRRVNPAPNPISTWGVGDNDPGGELAKQRAIASAALAEQDAREANASATQHGSLNAGPMAVSGMEALQRRDYEDAGLARAKERNGMELGDREAANAASAERRMGMEKKAAAQVDKATGEKKPMTMKDRISGGMQGIASLGGGLMNMAAQRRADAVPRFQLPQMMPITSAIQSKMPAPMPGLEMRGRSALEAAQSQNEAMMSLGPSVGGGFTSDDRAKLAKAWDEGHAAAIADVEKASRMPSEELKRRSEGNDYVPAAATARSIKAGAWEEGNKAGSVAARMAAQRQKFEEQAPGLAAEQDARVEAMAQANRAMQAEPYTYKPGIAEANGQDPREVNVGPMAQKLASDPVAATAVTKDPNTGLLGIDRDKALKVAMGGISALQKQIDELRPSMMAQRLRGRK